MNRVRFAVAALLLTTLASSAWAWGSDGHRLINHLAAQNLPNAVPAFVRNPNGVDVIEWLGPEPDRWRNKAEEALAAEQAPDHFIDLEWADLVGKLPTHRYDFIRALAEAQKQHPDLKLTPEKVGMQPWEVEEIYEKLKVDFREYRKLLAAGGDTAPVETAILYDCGWLGHYVGDGSNPMHTSIQYNGWTGPNPHGYSTDHGIHAKFESVFVGPQGANIQLAELQPLVTAAPLPAVDNEWDTYLDYLHHTNSLVEHTYQLEKDGAFNGTGTPDGRSYVDERLAAGAIELRNLIYTAWLQSNDPVDEFHG